MDKILPLASTIQVNYKTLIRNNLIEAQMKYFFDTLLVATILLLSSTQPSHAYIDPGSGSIVMTAILGFLAAVGYTARKYFYKIKNLFVRKGASE